METLKNEIDYIMTDSWNEEQHVSRQTEKHVHDIRRT